MSINSAEDFAKFEAEMRIRAMLPKFSENFLQIKTLVAYEELLMMSETHKLNAFKASIKSRMVTDFIHKAVEVYPTSLSERPELHGQEFTLCGFFLPHDRLFELVREAYDNGFYQKPSQNRKPDDVKELWFKGRVVMSDIVGEVIDIATMAYCNKVREQCGIKPLSLHELMEDKDWIKYRERVRAVLTALKGANHA